MTERGKVVTRRPTVQCIICSREYDRKDTEKYQITGIYENYCLCRECLHKEKAGWK